MKWKMLGFMTALSLALTACTSAAVYRERQNVELARFESHAGQPVERIRAFMGVDRWQSLSPIKLVIWTSVNRAWLLTLRAPCSGLEFQTAIGISSTNNVIARRFDKVHFENQVCFIEEIRPIDYKAIKQERHQPSGSTKPAGRTEPSPKK